MSRLPTIITEEKKRVMGAITLGPDARYNGKLRPCLKVMSWLRHYEVHQMLKRCQIFSLLFLINKNKLDHSSIFFFCSRIVKFISHKRGLTGNIFSKNLEREIPPSL